MLNHILNNREGKRVAVIVNVMSEVNIDADLIRGGGANLSHTDEKLIEMTNGCICCTLRDDLLKEVQKLTNERRFDYLLIESTGISEPLPVATTFDFRDEAGNSLADSARLDTMVTVVDAVNFLNNYASTDFLKDRGQELDKQDERTLVDLLIDQIEFANVIILNKVSAASPMPASSKPISRGFPLIKSSTPTGSILRRPNAIPNGLTSCMAPPGTLRKPRNTMFQVLSTGPAAPLTRPSSTKPFTLPCPAFTAPRVISGWRLVPTRLAS